MEIVNKLIEFANEYKGRKPYELVDKNKRSYQLIVHEIPKHISDHIVVQDTFQHGNLLLKGATGQGITTDYPWLAIFDRRITKKASEGIYVVMLYSDDLQYLYLTLNQGTTGQSRAKIKENKESVYAFQDRCEGFVKGEIPLGKLVRSQTYKTNNLGAQYEKTNIFYREYKLSTIDEADFVEHLERIITFYQNFVDNSIQGEWIPPDKNQKMTINHAIPLNNLYSLTTFFRNLDSTNLFFRNTFIKRFTALLLTKPFLLLTGLTGSGKTRIALTFAQWITEEPSQYAFIPVGSDWTNREPLLGYPNALEEGKYVKPDNGVLDLLLAATKDRERPYFLILDEMNLSHVERYFADFLSAMESAQPIPLHADTGMLRTRDGDEIPSAIELPANLFIIGTVNIDETTYMFSPKVLDRAGVLEFRVDRDDMDGFLSNPVVPDTLSISGRGAPMAAAFLRLARQPTGGEPEREAIGTRLITFFDSLKPIGAEFGYRTAAEIFRYAGKIRLLEEQPDPANPPWDIRTILDTAIVQKLLPKVHGSRRRVVPVLKVLAQQCVADGATLNLDAPNFTEKCEPGKILYPVSFEKICRMYDRAISDGFTSFAEA